MMALKREPGYYKTNFFKWKQRLGSSLLYYACNIAYLLANTYLLFYYTNCAGLDAGKIGFMFVVTKLIDAVTDYLVGTWVDRTDTKMGRYRPWLLAGGPILAVGMVALFSVPTGWGEAAKMAWAYISYIVFSFGYTLECIPASPLVSSLSADDAERTKLLTANQIFSSLGNATSSLFVLPMVYFFAGSVNAAGDALARGYRLTNMILGVVVIILITISVFNIVEVNPPIEEKSVKGKVKHNIFTDIKDIFKNKYYIICILYVFFNFLGFYGSMAAIQYYFTYVIGNTDLMGVCMSITSLLPIPVMLVSAYMNARGVSKGKLLLIGGIISSVATLPMIFNTSTAVVLISIIISTIGSGMRSNIMFAVFPDVYDYTEYQTGRYLGGTQYAFIGLGSKVASALASYLVSALLVWGAYGDGSALNAHLSAGGTVDSLAGAYPKAIMAIKIAFLGLTIVTNILNVLVIAKYDLDKKNPEIQAELSKRRQIRASEA